MKRPFKKLTAWLCCMAMLISFIPATALPVFATETEPVALTQTEGTLEAGSYELESDLTLTGDLTVPGYIGVDQVVTLDLAGHNLIAGETADGGLFAVDDAAGHLTITDSVGGGKLISGTSSGTPAVQIQAGTFTLEDGEITGWTREGGHGGMIFVAAGATFNMEGGKLTNATSAHGPAIRTGGADAVINMSDGEISNCTATSTAPIFLHTDSTFNMTGGTITGNNGVTGGAICLYSAGAEANIGGGTISSNKASGNGGAICANYGVVTVSGDAAITGNEATGASSYGGAIFLAKNTTANIKGGTISGNKAYRGGAITSVETGSSNVTVNISDGIIENNIATNRGANLYGYDATYNISGGTIGAATVNDAEATGNLNSELRGAETNISGGTIATICTSKGTDYTKLTITGNPVIADLQNSSTNTASTIGALTEGADITYSVIGGLTIADGTVKQVGKNFTYQKPTVPTSGTVAAGEYTLADDLVLTNTLTIAADTEVVIDLAGNTISMPDKDAVYFDVYGKLTIKDGVGGGKIQMKNTAAGHGGIYVRGTGTFVLEGGELNGWTRINDGSYGAGGMFGLWDGATFIMNGGKITGADCNGPSVIRTQSAGDITVTISGGEITGNHAQGSGIIAVTGTAAKNATLTINGTAKIDDNTWGANNVDFAATGTGHEIEGNNTHITIGGNAVVGTVYNNADDDTTDCSSYTFTGAPTVASVRWSKGAETPCSITELTEGASITMSSTPTTKDATVDQATTADSRYLFTYKVPTYAVTVNQVAGGTIEVDVEEGAEGTVVTVTATADEGYELVDILVNGKAIDGKTFQIVAGENVVTATFEAVDAALPTSGTVAAGEYVLTGDHVLTSGLTIAKDTEVTIDLAGHTISLPDKDAVYFTVNGKLTIKDGVGGGKVQFKETTAGNPGIGINGTFVLEGGELNGWKRAGAGGAVYLYANSTFIMTGGLITGCDANSDSVIRSNGGGQTVTITGGSITGNDTGARIIGVTTPTAGAGATITIGGDANISGNTLNGEAITKEEVFASYTHVTVGGEAVVGSLYANASDEVEGVEGFPYGSISITGAPTVGNITLNSSNRTPVTIKNLTEGASITTALTLGGSQIDSTVAKTETGYTWQDPATVVYTVTVGDVENGTVAVDPTEGVIGTTVTVTAEADEGYELTAILVDGEAIDGTTFDITGNHVVTATFTEVVVDTGLPTSGAVAAGEYVLEADHVLTGALSVTNAEVVIDLAGYTITAAAGGGAFTVSGTGDLTITDSVGGGKVVSGVSAGTPAVSIQGGTFTLEDGEITGWNREGGAGGMVFLAADTTFNMKGGKLTGATADYGAAIRVNAAGATVNMSGGEISGNKATGSYGPIILAADSTFNMTGGTITDNTGYDGGVIGMTGAATVTISGNAVISNNTATKAGGAVYLVQGSTFTMDNGTISGNEAKDGFGGAIYLNAITSNKTGTITVNGGSITGNKASGKGGAIGLSDSSAGTVIINSGTLTGNTAARGNAIHMGEGGASALTLAGGTTDYDDTTYGGVYSHTGTINVTGGTHEKVYMRVGTVTISGNPVIKGTTSTSGVRVSDGATATIGSLTTGASVRTWDENTLTIAENDETVYTTNNRDYSFKGDMGLADKFVPDATVTLEKDDTVGGGISLTAAGEYTLDLAGYTLTGNAAPYFTVGAGVKLTIIDSSAEQTGKIVGLTDANDAAMIEVNGEFVLNGGTLTGHTTTVAWAAVKLNTGSVMTMNGGEISGNTAYRGAGVSTGDVAKSNVTFTMSGGVIKDNATTNSYGSNIYLFQPAMATFEKEAVIGASYNVVEGEKILATSPGHNAIVRGGSATITGGTYKLLSLSNAGGAIKDEDGVVITPAEEATGVVAAISGNPVIELLSASGTIYATIGELTTGASIATDTTNPLNVLDNTVNVQGRLYQCSADLTKILIIGNSFGGDTINYLAKLGKFYGKGIDAANMYIGSQNFRWHAMSLAESLREEDLNGDRTIGDSRYAKYDGYNDEGRYQEGLYTVNGYSEPATFLDVLGGDKKWDYVVLQNGVEYVGFEGTYNSDVQFLIDYIKAAQPDAQIYFNQTWATDNSTTTGTNYMAQFGGDQAAMYNAILANTDKFFAGADARFAEDVEGYFPIGTAIQEMRGAYNATPMTRDGYHLSLNAGRMIAGLTVMKTLFDVDLDQLTAADVAAMFDKEVGEVTDSSNDAFDPTEENVAKLIAAVETACGYAADGTVAEYDEAAAGANKQFNPDAVMNGSDEYVAVYENVTEVGQAPAFGDGILMDSYATAGAGKIVIYKNGNAVGAIDELWLEANAGIVLTDRYEKIMNKAEYYIMADAQAPQLAVVNSELYMTFTVMLYTDDGQIINGGIYLTTSTDGVNWTCVDKVSEAPMAYGLTALADGTLMMSVTDTATKVLKLTTAGEVTNTVELADAGIADVAFAEANNTKGFVAIFALTSNGALYVSTDNGATWTATGVAGGAYASPNLVALGDKDMTVYVTWADEAEMKIYSKVWTVNAEETDGYGWNDTDAVVAAEYTPATAYSGKSTGGQPSAVLVGGVYSGKNAISGTVKTFYTSGNKLQQTEDYTIAVGIARTLTLADCLNIDFKVSKQQIQDMGGTYAKFIRTSLDNGEAVETIVPIEDWTESVMLSTIPCYQITFAGIAAKEMGDSVWFAVYNDEGEQLTRLDRYSIKTYAMNQLASTSTTATVMHSMLVDLLNYGAAAQTSFGYATDKLVNADLTEAQQALATPKLEKDVDLTTEGYVNTSNGIQCGKSFLLKNSIVMNLSYVAKTLPDNVAYGKISYVGHKGDSHVFDEVPLTDAVVSGTDRKEIQITTLKTADVRTLVTVELFDADGNYIEGTKVVYNVATYAYNKYSDASDGPLSMALMQFGSSAYEYLHS